ncbi:type II toxin-antitoxin system PemK/MazF family toxin [Anaerovibrio sp. JC8]|uniref:type II toxin-antitoxin system PemK/MazF family toxin n=1 Tax=Anaerovibrio sp. JC8 TaxID=1240085 RepID=UPI000A114A87|nr:type II toxin-antitoxin system PemK/MazF family toxin [Anaerovibrio sp. JC8]
MDFKDPSNKKILEKAIKDLLSEYQSAFDSLLNDEHGYKKGALLYYWLRDYKNYLENELDFSPNFFPNFKRGNIVNVNLGFNIGAEMGGLHYAVVLADSNRMNPNIVIAPLTSVKSTKDVSKLRPTELYIGEELFYMIKGKYTALRTSIPTEIKLLEEAAEHGACGEELDKKIKELVLKIDLLEKTMKKFLVLKHGSIVVLNQIRTISKMRVVDPTDKYDILYGLKLSTPNLDAMDEKMSSLYLRHS